MATILFSSIANGALVAFDPAVDILVFDDASISASAVQLSYDAANLDSIGFSVGGVSFTLSAAVLVTALTSSNVTFADGSRLLIGDDNPAANDIAANLLTGGAGGDQLLGLQGSDTIAGGAGNDWLDGGLGADLLRGGLGADTYVVDSAGDVVDEAPTVDTVRVSVSSSGVEGNANSAEGLMSADGRYVVFHGYANNLVAGDVNGASDVFVKDLLTGTVQRVSTTAAGTESSGGDSFVHSISPDGRYVVFHSLASNLVAGDGNGVQDVFVKDVLTGTIQRLSTSGAGVEANGSSAQGRFAADGRYVVFESQATNLVAGDTNGVSDIFVKDLLTGAVTRVNTDAAGNQANASATRAQISADGRYVLFDSGATNLLPGDTGTLDVFVKDLRTGTIVKVSSSEAGVGGNGASSRAVFSADGRSVVFETNASNLGVGDDGGVTDIVFKNLDSGVLRLVSADAAAAAGNGSSLSPAISADGRWVVFDSGATNLVGGDANGARDIFVKDMVSGEVRLVSTNAAGIQGSGTNELAQISADGRWISFRSTATTLVSGDTNAALDTFRVRNPLFADSAVDTVRASVDHTLGSSVENLVLTGTAAIAGNGNQLANRLTGNSGANALSGGAGNDTLDGGGGADTMTGGAGNDSYVVGVAGDRVVESAGGGTDSVTSSVALTLAAEVENLTLSGASAINGIGNALANRLTGNAAANTLNGAAGADTMTGGAGNDIYVVDNAGDRVVEASGGGTDRVSTTVSLVLAAQVENLTLGGSAAINGTGNTLANAISGNAAANTLDGGAGNDTMTGGAGDDVYVVDAAGDSVVEAASAGTDTIRAGIGFSLGALANVENLTLLGSASINATGNGGNNLLTGNAGNNRLDGGAGSDTASYAAAAGAVQVDLSLTGAQATGAGSDTLVAIENLLGSAYADTLIGNSAANRLDGGAGADLLAGGAGNDSYVVDGLADSIVEEAGGGTDLVLTAQSYRLPDEVENLTLTGSASVAAVGNGLANLLTGNAGNNLMSGGAGNDTLNGGSGLDSFSGGAGLDTFRFTTAPSTSSNADRIADFNAVDDRIELDNAVFTRLLTPGALSAANFRASATGTAGDSNDYLLYETDTGRLLYDADGSGAGAAVLIATLAGTPALTAADLFVI
ncbi:MAG: hypothetical protein QM722_06945 [Piscinibacter sp.]